MSDPHRFVAPARLIAGLTLFSRLLGLVREMLYAYFFGASPAMSSFTIAWQIPNLSRRLLGEGALSAAFVPVLTDRLHQNGEVAARRLAGAVLALLATLVVILLVLAEIGIGLAHWTRASLALRLTATLLPYMPLICLTAVISAALNVLNRFAVPAFAPVLLNVVVIAGAACGGWLMGLPEGALLYVVCGALLTGGVAQLILVSASLWRTGLRPQLNLAWRDPDVRRIAVMMTPMVLGMSAVQVNALADTLIAFLFVPDGQGAAVLRYAHVLYQLPLGVVGVALATAIFPLLAARASAGDMAGFTRACEQGLRMCMFVGLPAAVGLCLIANPLIRTFFEAGKFGEKDAVRVAWALLFYASGVWAYITQHVLVRMLYALQDSRTPARIAVTMVFANLALNLILVFPLEERGVALATAITSCVQVLWLLQALRGRLPTLHSRWILSGCTRMLLASIALALGTLLPRMIVGSDYWAALRPGLQLAVSVTAGMLAYALGARALRLDELRQLFDFRVRRI